MLFPGRCRAEATSSDETNKQILGRAIVVTLTLARPFLIRTCTWYTKREKENPTQFYLVDDCKIKNDLNL